jgi:hypothetical protein
VRQICDLKYYPFSGLGLIPQPLLLKEKGSVYSMNIVPLEKQPMMGKYRH